MSTSTPILTVQLFPELHEHLLALLRSLSKDDWQRSTVCSAWTVKDIASHLLDGQLRRLSAQRDGYRAPDAPAGFASNQDLVAWLTSLNTAWTAATRRLSPAVLIELLEVSGYKVAALFADADPFAPATFPVSWSGEEQSHMWLDVAREYTEWWHHQRQIALAVDRSTPLDEPRLYHPVLQTFFRALPFTFLAVPAPPGTIVAVELMGPAGGVWTVRHEDDQWKLTGAAPGNVTARVRIPQEFAWRIFTKRRSAQESLRAYPGIEREGDLVLANRALEMVSIMA